MHREWIVLGLQSGFWHSGMSYGALTGGRGVGAVSLHLGVPGRILHCAKGALDVLGTIAMLWAESRIAWGKILVLWAGT